MKNVTLSLDDKILNWINRERGNINRSKFINAILNKHYQKFKETFDWEKELELSKKDIENGDYDVFNSAEELVDFLKNRKIDD
jgi:hypothetical protein